MSEKMDAASSVFLDRQLRALDPQIYRTKFAEFVGRDLMPVNTNVPAGAKTYSYQMLTEVGMAKVVAAYADDLPRVDIYGEETTAPIQRFGDSFGWNIDEIAAAQMTGVPLEAEKGQAAYRAYEQKVDGLIATGETDFGIYGLLNNPNVTPSNVANPGSGTAWTAKTADQILTDMNSAVRAPIDATSGRERPDTMVIPDAQHQLIASTPRSSTSDTTILEFFLKSNGSVKEVIPYWRCNGAGASSTDRMVVYRRDPMCLQHIEPEPFRRLPPEQRNLEMVVNCTGKHAGVVVRYPLSMAYRDGI